MDKLHYICEQRKNSFIEESVNFRRQGRAGNMSSERGENVVRNLAYVLVSTLNLNEMRILNLRLRE